MNTSDGLRPKKLIPGRSRALNIDLEPSPGLSKISIPSLERPLFLLHKSLNFLGPSQKN